MGKTAATAVNDSELVVVHENATYEASLSRGPQDTHTAVSIYVDGRWAGEGRLDGDAEITGYTADLCDEEVAALLNATIADVLARGRYPECDPRS